MVEILGNNLEEFFDYVEFIEDLIAIRSYRGDRYEVWEVPEETFKYMCDMSEERFVELAGEDAWWRSSSGSNLDAPDTKVYVNGLEMLGWTDETWEDEDEEDEYEIHASCLTTYLCDVVGASQPRNICACAMDLAMYNHMTMGELFTKYEP